MKIAAFLPNWIGDVVMATPALRALRRHFAGARLIGVGKPYVLGVLDGCDWFDQLLPAHGGTWSQGIASTAWKLRAEGIDLAVLFPNTLRSALTAWFGSARRTIGYRRYGRAPFLTDALEPRRTPEGRLEISPVVDAYNRLAMQAGCPEPGYQLELFTTPQDNQAAQQVWEMGRLGDYPEVVCLNSGAAFGASKHWPTDYFAELARNLVARRGCALLVLCGPAEKAQAAEIVRLANLPQVVSLGELSERGGPRLSLGLTKACVQRADLLVTTDSGPRHFAHAFNRPVVTLFGPTHIAWTETYHPRAIHLQKQVECGPCQKRVCPLDHCCMKLLTPREVQQAVELLLQGS
ncbi:MAG: glycosyltransferase family 9 protein [Gemmataceae bacterium]